MKLPEGKALPLLQAHRSATACQRGSREAISKRRGTEPKTRAAIRIKCTSQYG